MQIPVLYVWIGLGAMASGFIALVLVLANMVMLRLELRKMRKRWFFYWQSYLDSMSTSLESLKALRAIIAAFRPAPHQKDLADAGARLYQSVREDIVDIETHLEELANASDRKWNSLSASWRPVLNLENGLGELLDLLMRSAVSGEKPAAGNNGRADHAEQLHAENGELHAHIVRLTEQLEQMRNAPGASAEVDEEAIAARLMAELSDALPIDQVEGRLAAVDGEIAYCKNQLALASDEGEINRLNGRIRWMEQVKRWWTVQKKVREQLHLLNESKTEVVRVWDDNSEERLEQAHEFQQVESKNADLRRRLAELLAMNHQMGIRLEELEKEDLTIEGMRAALTQVEMARKRTERELSTLSQMMEDMEDGVARGIRMAEKVRALEDDLETSKLNLKRSDGLIQDLKKELSSLRKGAEMERAQYESMIETLERSAESARAEKEQLETEMIGLQNSYDEARGQMVQIKAMSVQVEQKDQKAREELAQMKKEHQELQQRYRELRDEYAEMSKEAMKK